MSRKSAAVGTGAMALSPLVDIVDFAAERTRIQGLDGRPQSNQSVQSLYQASTLTDNFWSVPTVPRV